MGDRDDSESYVMVKYFMKAEAKGDVVDMYKVLDQAGKERSRADLESLGLPEDMEWDVGCCV